VYKQKKTTAQRVWIIIGLTIIGVIIAGIVALIRGDIQFDPEETVTPLTGEVLDGADADESVFRSGDEPIAFDEVRDDERIADIDTLKENIEAYFISFGWYPTLQDMNSDALRAQHFSSLDRDIFADPLDEDERPRIVGSPQKGNYAYEVRGADGLRCVGGTSRPCTQYTLSAILEDDSLYQVSNN
jgi:hypothetical protein